MDRKHSATAHSHQGDLHAGHQKQGETATDQPEEHSHTPGADHGGHVDHTGHELMFRNRFWVCLVLTIPVLLYSPALQEWLGFTMPAFPGSQWVAPLFSIIVFLYGGVPFLKMAGPELKNRQPVGVTG